jgi:cation:H+ antiporter
MLLEALLLVTGLVVLYFGAEWLVAGASKLALAFGISPLIIGLTIVAAATSAPEFVVSLMAALNGSPDIALGNVVGSNVANIALIVGAASVVLPMAVERSVLVRDYPFLLVSVVLMLGTAYTGGMINRPEGAVLVMLTLVFLAVCGRKAIAESRSYRATSARDPEATRASRLALHVVKIVVGLAGLVIGARLMVDNAVTIARFYGIPELVIGVTVVALGTSLPELATSLVEHLQFGVDSGRRRDRSADRRLPRGAALRPPGDGVRVAAALPVDADAPEDQPCGWRDPPHRLHRLHRVLCPVLDRAALIARGAKGRWAPVQPG